MGYKHSKCASKNLFSWKMDSEFSVKALSKNGHLYRFKIDCPNQFSLNRIVINDEPLVYLQDADPDVIRCYVPDSSRPVEAIFVGNIAIAKGEIPWITVNVDLNIEEEIKIQSCTDTRSKKDIKGKKQSKFLRLKK